MLIAGSNFSFLYRKFEMTNENQNWRQYYRKVERLLNDFKNQRKGFSDVIDEVGAMLEAVEVQTTKHCLREFSVLRTKQENYDKPFKAMTAFTSVYEKLERSIGQSPSANKKCACDLTEQREDCFTNKCKNFTPESK